VPLSLPNLDDLRWEDLLEEGRSLIPALAPEWTNHNPSDPGITLIELFAYFSERLMYQLNRIGDKNILQFLKLINGPEWKPEQAPAEEKRTTVRALRVLKRAVTAADFELLTQAVAAVKRAKCIPGRNLESEEPEARVAEAPGHVSIVVVPDKGPHPSQELLARVKRALEPARLLTTRVHAVGPRYLSLSVRVTIVPRRGTPPEAVREAAMNRLKVFFDPLEGWFDGKGWPFGRNVYVSELYQVLGELQGIESVMPTRDSKGVLMDELLVDQSVIDRLRRNNRSEVEAVELWPDELVDARIERNDVSLPPHL
jgi:Baseplate J-like protein